RGNNCAEVTISAHDYPNAVSDGYPADASDICVRLIWAADTNGAGFTSNAAVADVDVFIARDIGACVISHCDISAAGCVAAKRIITGGDVPPAGSVRAERKPTVGDIRIAGFVAKQRRIARGRVVTTSCVQIERIETDGDVGGAACIVLERSNTNDRISL